MHTVWKFPLPLSVDGHVLQMPRGATVLRLALQGRVPTLWVAVDDAEPLQPRRFQTFGTGADLGEFDATGYVGSYDQGPFVWHVFEARHADRLPARVAVLPLEAQNAYRLLRKSGFQTREVPDCNAPNDLPMWAWVAPSDEPLTTEQIMAVAELQEHGLGAVITK